MTRTLNAHRRGKNVHSAAPRDGAIKGPGRQTSRFTAVWKHTKHNVSCIPGIKIPTSKKALAGETTRTSHAGERNVPTTAVVTDTAQSSGPTHQKIGGGNG